MLAFLQNEFWFLRLPFILLYSFPKQYHLCFWFQLLISKPGGLPDLLFICLDIFTLLSWRHLKFSIYKILLVIFQLPSAALPSVFLFAGPGITIFLLEQTRNIWVAFFLSHIQLITKSHKSIDFTFSLRASMPTFLPGVLSFSHYFNTGILFWAMDSFS